MSLRRFRGWRPYVNARRFPWCRLGTRQTRHGSHFPSVHVDLSIRYGTLSCCSYHTVYCIGFDAEVAPDRRVVSMSYHLGSWRHALSWSTYACSSNSRLKLARWGTWSSSPPCRLAHQGTWSPTLPHRFDRGGGLGRPICLAYLLGGGLGHTPHLERLLGERARKRFMGLSMGIMFLGTLQQPPSLRATPWSRSEAFLSRIKSPGCMQVHQYDVALEPLSNSWGLLRGLLSSFANLF
jgi:hypothetical protein